MSKWIDSQSYETEQDTYRRTVAELDAERRVQEQRRHRLPCSQCGCPEGLQGWNRESVLAAAITKDKYPLPREFYLAEGYDPDRRYTCCLACNRADSEVLSRCKLQTAADIAAWVLEEECMCILDQTCGVCKLAAKIERVWHGDNPLPF